MSDQENRELVEKGWEARNSNYFTEAFEFYRKAAENGYAPAFYCLGRCYEEGEGVNRDLNLAIEWYTKAANKGNVDAQYSLYLCYENGKGVKEDTNIALEWLTKAANQGDAKFLYELGKYYFNKNDEQNQKKSIEWFTKAADKGYADAHYQLSLCYSLGKGVEINHVKKIELLEKAAEQNHSDALTDLGSNYFCGYFVKKDKKKGIELWKKAANQGNTYAQRNLKNLKRNKILKSIFFVFMLIIIASLGYISWDFFRPNEKEINPFNLSAASGYTATILYREYFEIIDFNDDSEADYSTGIAKAALMLIPSGGNTFSVRFNDRKGFPLISSWGYKSSETITISYDFEAGESYVLLVRQFGIIDGLFFSPTLINIEVEKLGKDELSEYFRNGYRIEVHMDKFEESDF